MGNFTQWSCHALRARPGLGSARLSCRATRRRLDGAPSWRQRSRPQPVNEAQDPSAQGSWDCDLRHLNGDLATVAHDLRADRDAHVARNVERPVLDLLLRHRCRLSARKRSSDQVAGATAPPPKADRQAATSASPPISSASPPGADLPDGAAEGPPLTQTCPFQAGIDWRGNLALFKHRELYSSTLKWMNVETIAPPWYRAS